MIVIEEFFSPPLLPHSTVFLTQSVIGCEQKIVLDWSLYEGWTNGIASQEVWVDIDGSGAVLQATVSASDTSYVFENASDSENYCFFIKYFPTYKMLLQ